MPILKMASYVEFYRHLAESSDSHVLSGRGDDVAATEFANSRILQALDLAPDDTLLDIGCGNGCLLRTAEGRVSQRIGIVPNVEEQERLQPSPPDLKFLVGGAHKLPLSSGVASKVACNGVLLLLKSDEVIAALSEVARVARPGARVWLGEIPTADEYLHFGVYSGNSVAGFLWYKLKKGPRAFLSSVKTVISAAAGRQTLILNSARIFHAPPEQFISMAQECGLRPVTHFKYERLDKSGKIIESPFRYNYIFVR